MPRMQIEATALKNTDVSFVSLVKHGANRIPFRIVKEDNEAMLDLGKIGKALFRKSDVPAGVVAALVRKGADLPKYTKAFEAAGLVITQKSETDEMVVYTQPGVEAGGRDGTLRLNDDVALMVNGLADLPSRVQKDFSSYDGTSTNFMAVLNTEMFFPSMLMAADALTDTIMNIMNEADSPSGAAELVGAAIDDFKSYIMPCITGIPVRAFKADLHVQKATDVVIVGVAGTAEEDTHKTKPGNQTVQSGSGIGAGGNANGTGYDPAEDAVRAVKAETPIGVDVKAEPSMTDNMAGGARPTGHGGKNMVTGSGEAPIGTDTTKETAPAESAQAGPRPTGHGGKSSMGGEAPIGTDTMAEHSPVNDAQGRGDTTVAGLMKGFEDVLAASIGAFRTEVLAQLNKTDTAISAVTARLDGVEARTVKAEEALNGTVLGDAAGDPPARPHRTQKSEGAPPLLDTGFSRRAA